MVKRFIEWLHEQIGSIYVWGAQGETCFNTDWIKRMETNDKNGDRAVKFYEKQCEKGLDPIAAYDCSGLIVRFFVDNDIIMGDMTSRGLYGICKKITKAELAPGDLVFRHNGTQIHHVGVYVGDGMVIHAKGRDVGVVKEGISTNGEEYWNRFGRVENLSEQPSILNFPRLMTYGGSTYVNLRTEPSAVNSSTIIERVSAGETVLVLGISYDGWAEVVKKSDDDTFLRGFCIAERLK